MAEMNQDEILQSAAVRDFITVAVEFCAFTEKVERYTKEDVLNYYQKISPLLYLKGSTLPLVNPQNPDKLERFVNEEQWEHVFNSFKEKIGEDNDVFLIAGIDPERPGSETLKISLAEQISDTYQDIKDCVMLFSKNTQDARENALAEVSRLFQTHWGSRIIYAMQQIHTILLTDPLSQSEPLL